MGRTCVVGNCEWQKIIGISFHRIPATMLGDTRRKWIQLIQHSRNDPNWDPNGNERICGHHFDRWMELTKPADAEAEEPPPELTPVIPQPVPVRRVVPERKSREVPARVADVKPDVTQIKGQRNGSSSSLLIKASTPPPPPPPLKKIKLSPSPQSSRPVEAVVHTNAKVRMPIMPRLQPRANRNVPPLIPNCPQPPRSNPIIRGISNQITVTYVGQEEDAMDQGEVYEENNSEELPIPSCLVEAVFAEGSEPEAEDDYNDDSGMDQPYFSDNQYQVNELHLNSKVKPTPVFRTFKYPRMGNLDNSKFLAKCTKGLMPNGTTSKFKASQSLSNGTDIDMELVNGEDNSLELFNKIMKLMGISPLQTKKGQNGLDINIQNEARDKVRLLGKKLLKIVEVDSPDISEHYYQLRENYDKLMESIKLKYASSDVKEKGELLDLIPETIPLEHYIDQEQPTEILSSTSDHHDS